MSVNDFEKRARDFVVHRLSRQAATLGIGIDQLVDDFQLMESGLIDSMGFVELIADLELEFDLEIDFEDMDPEKAGTVGGLVRLASGGGETA